MMPGQSDSAEPDFGDFLASMPGVVEVEEGDSDNAMQRVARRIAGQHGENLLRFTRDAFAQSDARALAQETVELTKNLVRLAKAAENQDQVGLLEEFLVHASVLGTVTGGHPSRTRALARLREWIPRFAATLHADQAKQLMEIVQPVSFPLRDVLKEVPGVGRARLTRMYAAGLYTLESLANGSAEEIAAVTGMPRGVAQRVIDAAYNYARDERIRCLADMQTRSAQFERILAVMPDDTDADLRRAAREALEHMQATLNRLDNQG